MTIAWPLPTPVQTEFNPSVRFKAKRPWGGTQERWHAGLDLRAKEGTPILAPEPCVIVDVDRGWDGTAKATLVHTASGHSLLLGCTALGSAPPVGTKVPTGGVLATVGHYTKTDDTKSSMLHFQAYNELITPAQANARQSWKLGAPQPQGLIDPLVYLAGAEDLPAKDLPDPAPPGPLVSASDGRTGAAPCHTVNGVQVCSLPDVSAWRAALVSYRNAAEPYIAKANELVSKKLASWTPAASAAVDACADADLLLNDYANHEVEGLPDDQVADLVGQCISVRSAIDVLNAFVGQKPAPTPKPNKPAKLPTTPTSPKRSSGGAMIAAGGVVLALLGVGTYAATRR